MCFYQWNVILAALLYDQLCQWYFNTIYRSWHTPDGLKSIFHNSQISWILGLNSTYLNSIRLNRVYNLPLFITTAANPSSKSISQLSLFLEAVANISQLSLQQKTRLCIEKTVLNKKLSILSVLVARFVQANNIWKYYVAIFEIVLL